MSSQLSVMMEDLWNPIQWKHVTLLSVCLCREENGVFVNTVSLEVYRKIQSGPGKPSFEGASIFFACNDLNSIVLHITRATVIYLAKDTKKLTSGYFLMFPLRMQ